jgi:hypothetical protein
MVVVRLLSFMMFVFGDDMGGCEVLDRLVFYMFRRQLSCDHVIIDKT